MPQRKVDPNDILVPEGYRIDVFATNLTTPINITFTDQGEMLIADAGVTDGNGKVLSYKNGQVAVLAEGFNVPLTGITYHDGLIYVAHRGFITTLDRKGNRKDILQGLPSLGDHHNNRVVFGTDGKMYFGQGTATNSGVVGTDNQEWLEKYPFFHDYPGSTIELVGQNFTTENVQSAAPNDTAHTGAYLPFGVPSTPNETISGIARASGSILKANPDGSDLELVAWGLRNPFRMLFDHRNRLFTTNHGSDVRGSRPINNSPDEFFEVKAGAWYGWPDFTGGEPVTDSSYKPPNMPQPQFILAKHPMTPPKPLAVFEPHAAIMGFDFIRSENFGKIGDVIIAEYGSEAPETTGGLPLPGVGHRVSYLEIDTGRIYNCAVNKSGVAASETRGGGFERPIDAVFAPDGSLLIADFNYAEIDSADNFIPNTGVIWRMSKI